MLNKADLLRTPEDEAVSSIEEAMGEIAAAGVPPATVVLVSAERRWGLDRLLEKVAAALDGDLDGAGEPAAAYFAPRETESTAV